MARIVPVSSNKIVIFEFVLQVWLNLSVDAKTCRVKYRAPNVQHAGHILQRLCANRSDRYGGIVRPVSSTQLNEDPTNAYLGGTSSGQTHFGLL